MATPNPPPRRRRSLHSLADLHAELLRLPLQCCASCGVTTEHVRQGIAPNATVFTDEQVQAVMRASVDELTTLKWTVMPFGKPVALGGRDWLYLNVEKRPGVRSLSLEGRGTVLLCTACAGVVEDMLVERGVMR